MKLLVKPRLQKDKWSLYWKTSMATQTLKLDELEVDVPLTTTAKELKAMVAKEIGLPPVTSLLRLEGFEEPWELIMHKGHEMEAEKSLEENGVKEEGAEIVCVRKVLVAEGWKIIQESFEDSDTEEDDF